MGRDVLGIDVVASADEQKDVFARFLEDTLGENPDFDTLKDIYDGINVAMVLDKGVMNHYIQSRLLRGISVWYQHSLSNIMELVAVNRWTNHWEQSPQKIDSDL